MLEYSTEYLDSFSKCVKFIKLAQKMDKINNHLTRPSTQSSSSYEAGIRTLIGSKKSKKWWDQQNNGDESLWGDCDDQFKKQRWLTSQCHVVFWAQQEGKIVPSFF